MAEARNNVQPYINVCARTKPASTEPLNIFRSRGGRNRERKMSHPTYKPPPALYTKDKVVKGGGGRICGTLQY